MAVFVGVMLGGLFGVMLGLQVMAVSHMGVMAGLFVIVCVVLFRCGAMMLGGVFMVLSGLIVMVSARLDMIILSRTTGWRTSSSSIAAVGE
jgi:hypothetical protein